MSQAAQVSKRAGVEPGKPEGGALGPGCRLLEARHGLLLPRHGSHPSGATSPLGLRRSRALAEAASCWQLHVGRCSRDNLASERQAQGPSDAKRIEARPG